MSTQPGDGPGRSLWGGIELLWELETEAERPRRRTGTALDREQGFAEALRLAGPLIRAGG